MNKDNYKECTPVNPVDNAWLEYYHKLWLQDGLISVEDECKYARLGFKYSDDDDWYYQYDRTEKRYYVVVDKED